MIVGQHLLDMWPIDDLLLCKAMWCGYRPIAQGVDFTDFNNRIFDNLIETAPCDIADIDLLGG